MKPRLEIKIRGGLGNQLFGLFGAVWTGQTLERKTILDITDIDKNHTFGKYDLRSFKITAPISVRDLNAFEMKARRLSRFIIKGNRNSSLQEISINSREHLFQKLKSEISLGTLPSRIRLEGFFQDFSFFDSIAPEDQRLELENPSTNFLIALNEMKIKKPIVIHIRIGDYLHNNIGILSENYFASSIEVMEKSLGDREIWIFTNSPEKIASLYPGISKKNLRILSPVGDPAESMILMSEAGGIICSNSTFSFWAAKLSKPDSKVVVPKIYSKDPETQIRNIPKKWTQMDNTWL